MVGQTILKTASNKMIERKKSFSENQYVFIPFVFDIFCFIKQNVIDVLQKVQMIMHINVVFPRFMDVVFKRTGLLI